MILSSILISLIRYSNLIQQGVKLFWPVGVEIIDSVGTRGVLLSLGVASNLVFDFPKFVAKRTASFED